MHILFISRCPPYPLHLGDRLIVYHLARTLAARGHTLDLLALDDGAAGTDALMHRDRYAAFFRHARLFPQAPRPLPALVRRALLPAARFPTTAESAWQPDLWRAIEEARRLHRYDLAHSFGGISAYELAGALGGLPALITPYESYSLLLRRQRAADGGGAAAWARQWFAQRYESFMFAPYRRVGVVSQADADALHALNPAYALEVIPNGVDLAHFAPQHAERIPGRLLFVGNYAYAPNADAARWLAHDVLPHVRAAVPTAHLRLVGNAPPPDVLALAGEGVEVVGRVDDVRPEYAAAAVFACGLRSGAGIKNKVLEALAMRCPVVLTPLSADGIAIEDGQHALIAPADAAAFAAALVRALNDADLRARLGEHGHRLMEACYSWDHAAARYEAVYGSLIDTN